MKNGDRVRETWRPTGSEVVTDIRLELMEPEPGQWFIRMVEADSKDSEIKNQDLERMASLLVDKYPFSNIC